MPKRARDKEKVNLYGEVYELKKPSIVQAMELDRIASEENADGSLALINFLASLGLPKKVAMDLEAEHLTELVKLLIGSDKRLSFKDYQLAKMANFYGWDHEYLVGMDAEVFLMYYKAIEPIEAQKQIARFTVGDWPNLKKSTRKEIFRNLNKVARSVIPRKKVKLSKELLESIISQYKR